MRLLKHSPTPLQQADLLEKEGRALDVIYLLTDANRAKPSPDIERRLVQARLRAFFALDRDLGFFAPSACPDPQKQAPLVF